MESIHFEDCHGHYLMETCNPNSGPGCPSQVSSSVFPLLSTLVTTGEYHVLGGYRDRQGATGLHSLSKQSPGFVVCPWWFQVLWHLLKFGQQTTPGRMDFVRSLSPVTGGPANKWPSSLFAEVRKPRSTHSLLLQKEEPSKAVTDNKSIHPLRCF